MARNYSEEQKKIMQAIAKRNDLIRKMYYKEKKTGYEIAEIISKKYKPVSLQRIYEIIKKK